MPHFYSAYFKGRIACLPTLDMCIIIHTDLLANRRFSSKEQRRSLVEQSAHNANEILGIYERIKSQENEPEANSLDQKSGLVLKDCAEKKCHNRGYCDYQVGECRCRGGWTGPSCDIPFFRTCLEGNRAGESIGNPLNKRQLI